MFIQIGKVNMNNNELLDYLKAELNSISTNYISIEDSNRIASDLFGKCNDVQTCIEILSLLKSNSKKTLSFKKIASAYLKNMYQGTSTPLTKSQAINSNSKNSNDNMFEASTSHAELTNEEEKNYNQNKKKKFIYQEYSTDDYKHHTMIMGANKFYWLLMVYFVFDTLLGYFILKDDLNLPTSFFHWLISPMGLFSVVAQFNYFIDNGEIIDTAFWQYKTGNYTFDQLVINPIRILLHGVGGLLMIFLWLLKMWATLAIPYVGWCFYKWVNDK